VRAFVCASVSIFISICPALKILLRFTYTVLFTKRAVNGVPAGCNSRRENLISDSIMAITRAKQAKYYLSGSPQSSLSYDHEESSAKENVETNTEVQMAHFTSSQIAREHSRRTERELSGGSGPAVPPARTPIPEAEPEEELRISNSELEQGLQTFEDRTYEQVLDMTPAGWEKKGRYVQIKRVTTRSLPRFVKHKSVASFAYMILRTGGTMLKRVRKGGVNTVSKGGDKEDDEWIKASNSSNEVGYEMVAIPDGERDSRARVHRMVVSGMKFKNEDGIEEPLVPTMGHHNAVDHHNKDRGDSGYHNLVSCTQAYNSQNRGTSRPVTLRFADGEEIEFMSRRHALAWTGIPLRAFKDAVASQTVRTWKLDVVYQGEHQELTPLSKCHLGRKFTVSYTNVSV